jgi:hypothetical protein
VIDWVVFGGLNNSKVLFTTRADRADLLLKAGLAAFGTATRTTLALRCKASVVRIAQANNNSASWVAAACYDLPVSGLCHKHKLQPTLFYQRQKASMTTQWLSLAATPEA